MKIFKTNNSQSQSSPHLPLMKNKDSKEFEFFLEEFLNEDKKEWKEYDEYQVLLPRYGRFWDNGYEDVERGEDA